MEPNDDIYYAAFLSPEIRQVHNSIEPETLVSPDMGHIIDLCKKYKGSRFKSFRTFNDALKYTEEDLEEIQDISTNSVTSAFVEVAPPFPSLDIYQINDFKRKIKEKDLPQVEAMIQLNPRFLINYTSDDPTIVQQGARYNAVLFATFVKAPDILEYFLETVNSLSFIKRCYPNLNDDDLIIEKRDRFLDAFLNTPEHITFNTPLHLACRACEMKCIKILLNYVPTIDTNRKNKSGKLPIEMLAQYQPNQHVDEHADGQAALNFKLPIEQNPHILFYRNQEQVFYEMRRRHSKSSADDSNVDELVPKPIENEEQLIACQQSLMNEEKTFLDQVSQDNLVGPPQQVVDTFDDKLMMAAVLVCLAATALYLIAAKLF